MNVLRPVHPEEHTGVSVHVEHALKVVFVQVLQTADVEIEQLVRVAKVVDVLGDVVDGLVEDVAVEVN